MNKLTTVTLTALFAGLLLPFTAAGQALSVTNGLKVWLDAGTITGVTNGATVTAWNDSAIGLITGDAAQNATSVSGAPTFSAADPLFDGRPSVVFDGNDALGFTGALGLATGEGAQPFTIFIVATSQSSGIASGFSFGDIANGIGDGTGGSCVKCDLSTSASGLRFNGGGNRLFGPCFDPAPARIGFFRMGVGTTYGNATFRSDNRTAVQSSVGKPTETLHFLDEGYYVGAALNGQSGLLDEFANGRIAEILFYNRELSDTEADAVGYHLEKKYGLATEYKHRPPNIVVILVDDMGYSDLGCYGGEARTPNIDALAAGGLRFRDFHNTARCSPTRASLLTGVYSHQVTVVPGDPLPNLREDNNITLAELLKDQDYRTYMAGKWHLGETLARLPWARGFQHVAGFTGGGAFYWKKQSCTLTSTNNEVPVRTYGNGMYDFYLTDALADYSIDFIDHHVAKGDAAPFFLYLAFNAPHFDIAAPASTATDTPPGGQSYLDIYEQGWDVLRQNRYNKMLTLGVINGNLPLPPNSDTPYNPKVGGGFEYQPVPAWDTLEADRKADLARRMALYTAMIDKVDGAVGRVVEQLRTAGRLDNTLIFLLSDNGCSAEGGMFGATEGTNNAPPLTGSSLTNMGQPSVEDNIWLGGGWANVANTPFRYYKRYSHEGGTRTPLIVHWPAGIANPGRWSNQPGHLIDIMRTVVDVTGTSFPTQYNGHAVVPMEGESLTPIFNGGPEFSRQIGFEHEATRAWRDGRWKLVTKTFNTTDWSSFANTLELYDMETDPTELNNIAFDHPDRLVSMINDWNAWAQRVGVPSDRLLSLPKLSGPGMLRVDLLLDTFDRNDLADIDASTNGMSGALFPSMGAGAVHYEGFEGSMLPDSIRVFGGTLELTVGVGMSESGIMHNFTNQAILEAGGFVVEMDVVEILGNPSSEYYAGFGVGLTQSEAAAGGDIAGTMSFRGITNNPTGKADFFVEIDTEGNVKVWSNGQLKETLPVGAARGRLTASFALDSFSAGAAVEASVFFNGRQLDINTADTTRRTRTFTWDAAGQNYVGLSGRGGLATIDNLSVRTFPLGPTLASGYAQEAGLSGHAADPDGDPDGDARSNYLEWLIGSDPAVADKSVCSLDLLAVQVAEGRVRIEIRRLLEAQAAGVAYNVYSSTDLVHWNLESPSEISASPVPEKPDYEKVQLEILVADPRQDCLFLMIRYEESL